MIYILIAYMVVKIYLEILQLKFVKNEMSSEAVILPKEDYQKAGIIAIVNKKFEIFKIVYSFLIAVCWIGFGFEILNQIVANQVAVVMSFLLINMLLDLLVSIYETFVKDKKFGFSNATFKTFASDTIKSLLLTLIFGTLFVWVILFCIENFSLWWIYAFGISFAVILIINLIYPTIIAPLFNKVTPLDDGELKDSISDLLQSAGFKSSGVFVMDASKRDNRLNAYFGGFGATKRVVLFDTLIAKLSKNEIIAVLGHELGHFKHGDIIKNIALMSLFLFILFFIFSHIPNEFFLGAGLDYAKSSSVILFFFIFSPVISFIFQPILSAISRSHEFGADEFGANKTTNQDMANALKKLAYENKAFPKAHKLYASIYFSHPSLLERINRLENESF
ncbi:MAG: M48 family metallopeptidase [Campylobacter sp.]|nr:M48 family metallopeptidase [Campylobacter sp.]